MPIAGERKATATVSRGYAKDPMAKYAAEFMQLNQTAMNEAQTDFMMDPVRSVTNGRTKQMMKDFFVEQFCDINEFAGDMEAYEEKVSEMEALFENDVEAIKEHADLGSFNPVIGMALPIHKNLLMNNVYDKGAIPKVVAVSPKFTISMETRNLITPDGQKIDFWKEQNKLTDAINATVPWTEVVVELPYAEVKGGVNNVLAQCGGGIDDHLDIDTHISQVAVTTFVKVGESYMNEEGEVVVAEEAGEVEAWIKVKPLRFNPGYGEYDRQIMQPVAVEVVAEDGTKSMVTDAISGYLKEDLFALNNLQGNISKIKVNGRLDTSNAMIRTCSVQWEVRTDIVEIGSSIPLNTTISPNEIKDINALYQINQLTKYMSMFKTVMANYKDDMIKKALDDSYMTMNPDSKMSATFDFAPRDGYYSDHIDWRHKTFMDAMDTHVTNLLQVLNDANMTITVFGRPDLIRKLTPTEYTYQSPSSIGPVELDYVKTVVTSDKRVYQFIGSDKMRGNNNLVIILCPRNSERIMYRIYDYQLYVSNEIRNIANPALPAVHAFERWKFVEYQPVQGRVKILNPTGLREWVDNDDPIGTSAMYDFHSNYPEGYVAP